MTPNMMTRPNTVTAWASRHFEDDFFSITQAVCGYRGSQTIRHELWPSSGPPPPSLSLFFFFLGAAVPVIRQ